MPDWPQFFMRIKLQFVGDHQCQENCWDHVGVPVWSALAGQHNINPNVQKNCSVAGDGKQQQSMTSHICQNEIEVECKEHFL